MTNLEITDQELTAIYAALVHGTQVCNIFWEQNASLKAARDQILDRVTDEMELRGLLAD